MMVDPTTKPVTEQMLELEARAWLQKGYNTAAGIEQLRELLRQKGRSQANITKVVDQMRTQWKRRSEWL